MRKSWEIFEKKKGVGGGREAKEEKKWHAYANHFNFTKFFNVSCTY